MNFSSKKNLVRQWRGVLERGLLFFCMDRGYSIDSDYRGWVKWGGWGGMGEDRNYSGDSGYSGGTKEWWLNSDFLRSADTIP